MKVADIFIIYF